MARKKINPVKSKTKQKKLFSKGGHKFSKKAYNFTRRHKQEDDFLKKLEEESKNKLTLNDIKYNRHSTKTTSLPVDTAIIVRFALVGVYNNDDDKADLHLLPMAFGRTGKLTKQEVYNLIPSFKKKIKYHLNRFNENNPEKMFFSEIVEISYKYRLRGKKKRRRKKKPGEI